MPAAPSTSATAAEWTVENFDCSPLEGSTTSVIDSTKGCTRSFISRTASGAMRSRLRSAIMASMSGWRTTPQA